MRCCHVMLGALMTLLVPTAAAQAPVITPKGGLAGLARGVPRKLMACQLRITEVCE